MKKTIGILTALLLIVSVSGFVMAAPNPSGTGQPSASCGSTGATVEPNGFSTSGFAHAETVYAGSDGTASLLHSNSGKAVSQYDVACYQLTSKP